ncbi:phosphatidylinositol 4-kinase gamma 7 [Nicotiana attenuata]|uniref:Phosphatidylinositol 4-kinase gamma 7 n=1 Tax=Nicotiana attenuata TaxID=49451 RepID=A0A314L277_NICAT|nr:phosphatidylinositol 4-kinase gamma 7 [Nicotiana attenuata]
MTSRKFRSGEEEPSELEVVCLEARRLIAEREILSPKSEVDEEFQFDIDCEDAGYDYSPKLISQNFMNRTHFIFQLEEMAASHSLN